MQRALPTSCAHHLSRCSLLFLAPTQTSPNRVRFSVSCSAAQPQESVQKRTRSTPKLRRIQAPQFQQAPVDVDQELWEVLDLCSDEELQELHAILFGRSPLSPVIKSIVSNEPAAMHYRGRTSLMHMIESRFRFLAADANSTLRGRRPSYRESLLSIRERLEVQCPSTLSTQELETEIFLHMLQLYSDSEHSSRQAADAAANSFAFEEHGDGMAQAGRQAFGGTGWMQALETVAAPLKLGGTELVPLLVKLTSAVTVSSVKTATLRSVGSALLQKHVQYEIAVRAACRGAVSNAARQTALRASQRGLTAAAARYGALRGILSTLGPLMWAYFGAELALRSIGTDYGRIVRAMYTLAQIRLVRTHGWSAGGDQAA